MKKTDQEAEEEEEEVEAKKNQTNNNIIDQTLLSIRILLHDFLLIQPITLNTIQLVRSYGKSEFVLSIPITLVTMNFSLCSLCC